MKDRRRRLRRSGSDRRSFERRALRHRGSFLMGLGSPDLNIERRHILRRIDYRRSLFNRRAA
jgi:hypothetical protein